MFFFFQNKQYFIKRKHSNLFDLWLRVLFEIL